MRNGTAATAPPLVVPRCPSLGPPPGPLDAETLRDDGLCEAPGTGALARAQ
jgi:hypothetical protein